LVLPAGSKSIGPVESPAARGLFPEFADRSFDQLVATFQSGLPTLRNETGGHGQGATPVNVPEYVASYALNLAAAKIRFLVDAFKASANKAEDE
jgi:hypothetical protein